MARHPVTGLGPLPRTLLAPLWARASETLERHPLLADWNAVATAGAVDFDFRKLRLPRTTRAGACTRTLLIDAMVRQCLTENPGLQLVNLGEGLDNRFGRVDNGALSCIDLDLPEVVEIRKRLMPESARRRLLAADIGNASWIDNLDPRRHVLLVAEGVLMYLPEPSVRTLLARLAHRLPGCELIFDSISPQLARLGSRVEMGRSFRAGFQWGLRHASEIERWAGGYRLIERRSVFHSYPERFPRTIRLLTHLIPALEWSHSINRVRLES